MQGVIYARYSSDNQREESIEGQLRECKAFAESNDIRIVDTYIDRALSAKTDNRPSFQKMIKDSASHKFEVVIVWKLDRFSRNRIDSAMYKSVLRKNGIKVISATENISDGADGILLESVLEGMAEYHSAELSEKVIRGMTENALKCKWNGGNLPLGYYIDEDKKYQIDNKTAPIVSETFKNYVGGDTIVEVADFLNSKGLRNKNGKPISKSNVNYMLKNRRYMGNYIYKDMEIEGGIPQIISPELFENVQNRIAKNAKAPARKKAEDDYILTTKLFCGKCGRMMAGESGRSHNGEVYRYYKCSGVKRKLGCDKKSVKKDLIENFVVSRTMEIINDDDLVAYMVGMFLEYQEKGSTIVPALQERLKEVNKALTNLLKAIEQGIFGETTQRRMGELESEKTEIENNIAREEMNHPKLAREEIEFFIEQFRYLDTTKLKHRQRLVDVFVNSIFLYDDEMKIQYNLKNKIETLSLKDIESSDLSSVPEPY